VDETTRKERSSTLEELALAGSVLVRLAKVFWQARWMRTRNLAKVIFVIFYRRYTEEHVLHKALLDLLHAFAKKEMPRLHRLHCLGTAQSHGSFLFPVLTKLHRLTENNGAASIELTAGTLRKLKLLLRR
jgi:hypothetical protein